MVNTEYLSNEFNEFCEIDEIIHQINAPYSPQHDGNIENKNRTLIDMINVMLLSTDLITDLWGETLFIACYILNRVLSKKSNKSPYEILNKRKPNLGHLKV